MAETQREQIFLVQDAKVIRGLLTNQNFMAQANNVASKYFSPEKLIKVALLAAFRNPDLYICTLSSFIDSLITAGEVGLDFGGKTGEGYLIARGSKNLPRGVKECSFMPGYQGFIELAYRTNRIDFMDAQLVFANDKYKCNLGSNPSIKHEPKLDGDRGELLFGYGIVVLTGRSRPKLDFMTRAELMAIKDRSQSSGYGPWKTDELEMCRKTLIRRIWKYCPKTPELHAALEADNVDFDPTEPAPFPDAADENEQKINDEMGSETVEVEEPTNESETKTSETAITCTCTHCDKASTANPNSRLKDGKFQCPKCLNWTLEPDGETPDQAGGESFLEDD